MPERVDSSRVLLSTAEASELTELSSRYIQRLLTEGRIEGVRIAGVWLAYEDSLKSFVAHPRKRGPKGSRKKTEQEQSDIPPKTEHIEVMYAEEQDRSAEKQEAQTTQSFSTE